MVCFGGHFDFFLEEVGENHGPQQRSSSWGGSLVLLLRRFWELGAPLAVSGTAFSLSATWLGYVDGWSRLFWVLGELLAPTSTTLTRSSSTSMATRDLGCWALGVAAAGDLSWLVELFCGFGRRFDRL